MDKTVHAAVTPLKMPHAVTSPPTVIRVTTPAIQHTSPSSSGLFLSETHSPLDGSTRSPSKLPTSSPLRPTEERLDFTESYAPILRRLDECIGTAEEYLKAVRGEPTQSSVGVHDDKGASWVGGLHRTATILIPASLIGSVNDATIQSLVTELASYDTSVINSGLTVINTAWRLSHSSSSHDDVSVICDSWPCGDAAMHAWRQSQYDSWSVCTSSSITARHSTATSPQCSLSLLLHYDVPQWSFESSWRLCGSVNGPQTSAVVSVDGWVRHWERCCTRYGMELVSVTQQAPQATTVSVKKDTKM